MSLKNSKFLTNSLTRNLNYLLFILEKVKVKKLKDPTIKGTGLD